ncbi:MAG TPA: hypothetical protein VEI97_12085 [bacterium]|nr:hypothetical protein [bacterium]
MDRLLERLMYEKWLMQGGVRETPDYDMFNHWLNDYRGNEGTEKWFPQPGHFPDKYKFPWHRSMSNESMYDFYGTAPGWVDRPEGGWIQRDKRGVLSNPEDVYGNPDRMVIP